jgi:hypothetical protein
MTIATLAPDRIAAHWHLSLSFECGQNSWKKMRFQVAGPAALVWPGSQTVVDSSTS